MIDVEDNSQKPRAKQAYIPLPPRKQPKHDVKAPPATSAHLENLMKKVRGKPPHLPNHDVRHSNDLDPLSQKPRPIVPFHGVIRRHGSDKAKPDSTNCPRSFCGSPHRPRYRSAWVHWTKGESVHRTRVRMISVDDIDPEK